MITNSLVIRRSFLVMSVGVVLFASGHRCFSQGADQKENELRQTQILLGAEGLDVVSPALKRQAFEDTERPMLPLGTESRSELHPGQGSQIHHPEAHSPEGSFAEDRRRIAALTESAERIAQAGLPEVAQGLRERAGQLERELAEKQERMQQEERQRTESAMPERQEQRRAGIERGDDPTPPLRELHEQMEQLRRDMHKLSEQIADLTSLIQQHHNPRTDRGRHEEMDEDGDDEDGDDEDGDDEDGDDEDGDDDDDDEMDDDEASDD